MNKDQLRVRATVFHLLPLGGRQSPAPLHGLVGLPPAVGVIPRRGRVIPSGEGGRLHEEITPSSAGSWGPSQTVRSSVTPLM